MKTIGYSGLAQTLKVLADSLPEMMSAMLRPHEKGERPLAGITDRIATHLNAEVCTIFLRQGEDEGLVCREAHGYARKVEGKIHSSQTGLTGRIFTKQEEMVLNYSVQNKSLGWVGRYDRELQTHCWSLLGVPIISSQQEDSGSRKRSLGVLKLENKRKMWSAICDGKYLKQIADRNNTPQAIYTCVEHLSRKANGSFYKKILPLANELLKRTDEIRAIQNTTLPEEIHILEAKMESIRWHTECLHHDIDEHVQSSAKSEEKRLAKMIHALHLALEVYEPFSEEDLMLARHVAAMLAAVLDIDLIVYFKGWEHIAHSLNHVSSDFMERLEKIIQFNIQHNHTETFYDLDVLLTSAIYISGTKGSETGRDFVAHGISGRDAHYIATQVKMRAEMYKLLADLRKVEFNYSENIKDKQNKYECDSAKLKAALDVIVHNAFHYGARQIDLQINQEKRDLVIRVKDNGVGLPVDFKIERQGRGDKKIRASDGAFRVPSGEGMGLFNTLISLRSFGAQLGFKNLSKKGVEFTIRIKEYLANSV